MKYRVVVAIAFLVIANALHGLTVGSNILVSVQSQPNFSGISNTMLGFGWFKNGFTLQNSSTICNFNSVYPVSGTVNMNGGKLILDTDLYFTNGLDLTGFGSIDGQSHAVHFPSNLNILPADAGIIEDVIVFLSNDLKLSSTLSFKGTVTLKGAGHTIFLGDDGGIELQEDAHLVLEDIDIKNVGGNNIALANDNAHITFDDTNLFFEDDLTFDVGSFLIKDAVHFYGEAIFAYDSAQTSTLDRFSLWQIHDDMQFNIGKKESVFDSNPLWFEDQSSVLRLSNCHLRIMDYGFSLLRGTIAYDSEVTIDTVGTNIVTGLMVGNGSVEDDPVILFDAGASVQLESSYFVFNPGSPNVIKTGAHKTARLSRNIGSNIHVLEDLSVPSMKVEVLSALIPPMVISAGKTVEYDDTLIVLPGAEFDITSGRQSQLSFLLNGNDSIFFTKGTLPFSLHIENAGNRIMGNGNIIGAITLNDSNAHVISELDGEFDNVINFQGGSLTLEDDLRFGVSSHLTGSGMIDLHEYSLYMPPKDFTLTSSINFSGQNAAINLNGKVSLSTTSTCSGVITINGHGNVLEILDDGVLEVAANSTLYLKDIRLEGIQGTNLRLTDSTSRVVFSDVLLRLSEDYTFSQGSFEVMHDVQVVGQHDFIYDSSLTSTILSYSKLEFSDNSTFSVGKETSNSLEPIYFETNSANLSFNDASWHVTNEGVTLTRGLVVFDHEVSIDIDSTSTANGLTMGTNIDGEDVTFILNANATLDFKTGHLSYNNFGDGGFIASGNKSARFVRREAFHIYLNTNLTMSNMYNELVSFLVPPVGIAPGKTLLTNNLEVKLGTAEFYVDGLLQIGEYHYLTGDGTVLVERASLLPLPLFISGTNNTVRGAGAIVAPTILADENAQVTFDLQGEFRSVLQLNGGAVAIGSNLDLGPNATINGLGTIDLGSQMVSLGATDMDWTSTTHFIADGGIVELNARLSLNTTVTISGTMLISGNGNVLEFKDGAHVVIEDGATLMYRDLRLEDIEEKHITCMGPNSKIVIDDSVIILGNDLRFDQGSVLFVNQVDVVGSYTFSYESSQTSTISKNSTLHVSDNALLKIGKNNPLVDEPIHFEDRTAVLALDNCNFLITASGMQFSGGTIRVDRAVVVDIDSTSTDNGLVLGNGQIGDTLTFELSPGATVKFIRGHTIYNVPTPHAIVSLSPTARFVRANDSVLHANYPVSLMQMTLDHSKDSVTTLSPGASLSYENTTFIVPGTEFNTTGVQTSPVAINLIGSGELYLNKGAYPLGTVVTGEGNLVHGNGNIVGPIILGAPTAELQWALNGGLANTLSLNGGTVTLLQDMHLSRGVVATTAGSIDLDDNRFILGSKELQWMTDMNFDGQSGEVHLNNDVHLSGVWTFTGDCVLNGNGNALYLGETGQLIVDNNTELRLKNLLLRDVSGENIRCLDDDGVLILDDVDWLQDDMFTFSHGAMKWNNFVHMCGTFTFAYQTIRTSTIMRQSTVLLDNEFTFTYDPIGSQENDLIEFEDTTANLQLTNARLVASLNGLKLTSGTLRIAGDSTIAADVIQENGNILQRGMIEIGDQTAQNEMIVKVDLGSIMRLARGGLVYKNIDIASLVMGNELSTIALYPNTLLDAQETIDVGLGRLEVSEDASFIVAANKDLIGSIFELDSV